MNGLENIVVSSPDTLCGTPVFAQTRVPVQNLLAYLEQGDSIDMFLYDFPTVQRSQAIAVLKAVRNELLKVA